MNAAFKALADPTRREILRVLRNGPRTSGEIADQFPTAWATVSRHLAQLRDAGLIISERQGQQIVYELNTTVFDDLIEHMLDWVKPGTKASTKPSARSGKRGGNRHA
jgi:ArsR family transcriptional regulator, arsenate/arsenite/antimonite-responsive transcriptional repressor